MKSPSEKQRARRDKKRAYQCRPIAIPEAAELPEPPVLPDVYTTDRRSMHPTRKQPPRPPSQKADEEQK
jgi:hypothetical protein